jgi:hypothetical protein
LYNEAYASHLLVFDTLQAATATDLPIKMKHKEAKR